MNALPSAVLFACSMNSVRSPMAEGLLKSTLGHRIYVDSVGVRGDQVNGFAVEVLAEIGIDISNHKPKTFKTLDDTSFDVVISLSPEAQHSAVELTRWMSCEVEYWPTLDPSVVDGSRERRLETFRQVRDDLKRRIDVRFPPENGN
ncbi:MAG: low molecular weight phosphatase family protein [Rhodospirillales bacterium]|jgi:protein-tyrosine-phosphatase|nr:low molecular weight phosphatase family protein [Rhodospirillaceae bacterium]MDP6429503.1 low molecular weight phosphatase family protein [Rhodospirillales bacterium]MDP6645546.1 low molecular weight phosphatase family protein [Rhodospirillales bacterium]MDP6840870.1 low molecular weight phosphatase family protein [Rhodospirillales bacterium]|tara:strand:+ start:503 stop:940 length:438 start_codon:yes stop_codon:yes gene_type:complete